ncbi:molybdopterin-synthase adenylyltransferase MoeB [Methyloversatilis sp. XJ19-49]|uniref:HesA/MoeB/ThiF family protein n=1 Tax=Methyloversatilis sp. XJ19-49 TaxID=2963429 RepID=UPI00211C0094|nr:molybdopterin-synthase adenylyltransferase MoeB [Methyloversatilis sp. XJ19-49]MCQ9379597.1 molybdopterin-synthase adenylyltransferase MoeB [Methyloversatilis sp. XJ19-49]
MNDEQLLRYSRHILLDPIGIEGQDRLLASRALIVGAGGLGCPAALYMAAAGVGTLVIVDDDEVDLTNLQRQVLHRQHSVGQAKVESARESLHDINPGIEVIALKTRLAGDALREQVEAADVVLDCSDNFATRHAINRACVAARTPLVSGAAIRFDGQVSVFDSRDADAPCYHCLFPEGGDADEVRCAVMGVFAPLTGIIGTMQAAEALKLLAHTGRSLAGRLLLLDALGMEWRSITLPRDPACEVCGQRP